MGLPESSGVSIASASGWTVRSALPAARVARGGSPGRGARSSVAGALLAALAAALPAQTEWQRSALDGRFGHALAYDSARGRVVLFGGTASLLTLSDTWEWNGNVWTRQTPAVSPPARIGHALAYDVARGRVVLFGGHGPGGTLSDTW